jgi:hypothetical protein
MSYAALELLGAPAPAMARSTRLRLDARPFTPAPPRRPGTSGRPRVNGGRLPPLSAVLTERSTRRRRVSVPGRYGEGARHIELALATGTAAWQRPGSPAVPLRWVLVRDPCGCADPQAPLPTERL